MYRTDICIAGAGIIGLSLALELQSYGLRVIVLEAGVPMQQASTAAAGMLAADDPHNPFELYSLSHLSVSLYPGFLDRIARLSGITVPFQTSQTLQLDHRVNTIDDVPLEDIALFSAQSSNLSTNQPSSFLNALPGAFDPRQSPARGRTILREQSVDPRQLASSLLTAVNAASIDLFPAEPLVATQFESNYVTISTQTRTIEAAHFIDCTGAWSNDSAFHVVPIKGQMLAVALPEEFPLSMAVRTRDIYIVPRTTGPNAGRAVIGATVEDVGFDKIIQASQIDELHRNASVLLPPLAHATVLESWSGLRPATPDRLPIMGPHPLKPNHWIATGHYRNGILLAPATAHVMAQLILNRNPTISLNSFSASRPTLLRTG